MKIVNISPKTSLHIYLHEKSLSLDERMDNRKEDEESLESAIYNCDGFYEDAAKALIDSFQQKHCDAFLIKLKELINKELNKYKR